MSAELPPPAPSTPSEEVVVIRPMRVSDIEPVSKIERNSFTTTWNAQAYVTELSNPAAAYSVAVVGDRNAGTERVIGYGGLWVIMDEAHITTIAVVPDFRGRHIGDRLLCRMLGTAIEKGATRATLEVRSGNEVGIGLYKKYGFVWAAIRKGYYADNNENADIMWIHDMTTPEWQRQFADNRAALDRA